MKDAFAVPLAFLWGLDDIRAKSRPVASRMRLDLKGKDDHAVVLTAAAFPTPQALKAYLLNLSRRASQSKALLLRADPRAAWRAALLSNFFVSSLAHCNEVVEEFLPVLCMNDLWMPLHAVQRPGEMLHGLDLTDFGSSKDFEPRGQLGYLIHVRGPRLEFRWEPLQDVIFFDDLNVYLGIASDDSRLHRSSEDSSHKLHAKANSQDRHIQVSQIICAASSSLQSRPSAQDQAIGIDLLWRGLVGYEIRLHLVPYAPLNEVVELSIVCDDKYSHCTP